MFDILWCPLMAVLSTCFEECCADYFPIVDGTNQIAVGGVAVGEVPAGDSNNEIIELCLLGFSHAIRIACHFNMETERDAYVSSLAKLTSLSSIIDIKAKNIAAIKALLYLANELGDRLDTSWRFVFQCISEMDRWQLLGDAVADPHHHQETLQTFVALPPQDVAPHADEDDVVHSPLAPTLRPLPPPPLTSQQLKENAALIEKFHIRRPSLDRLMAELMSQSCIISVDCIFTSSIKLNGSSILHFYRSLCRASAEEVTQSSRIFLLQKIVEISYYNMGRIRLEWAQIWRILTPHFQFVLSHVNFLVAQYAIDALRQLGMKFLDRDELVHFHTHNEFLKPFEYAMRHSPYPQIRDLIVQSMSQMIAARAKNIKSGWKSIYVILARAANERQDLTLIARFVIRLTVFMFFLCFFALLFFGCFPIVSRLFPCFFPDDYLVILN